MPVSSSPCVLVVADPGRVAELTDALGEPLPQGAIEIAVSAGGDDTIELFESRKPRVVVLTASLEVGDAKSLIEVLREMMPREQMAIVLVGDGESGPIRNALDAIDMKPDRFIGRPLSTKALRFAVGNSLDSVARARGEAVAAPSEMVAAPGDEATPVGSRTSAPGDEATPVGSRTSSPSDEATPVGSPSDEATPVGSPSDEATPVGSPSDEATPVGSRTSSPSDEATPVGSPSDEATPVGSRTSTPVRGSGPTRSIKQTEPLELHGAHVEPAHVGPAQPEPVPAAAREGRPPRAITETRGSGFDEPRPRTPIPQRGSGFDEPRPRTPTPQRGSGPVLESPLAAVGALTRFSAPVETEDVPPVVSRAATLAAPSNGEVQLPAIPRAPTDRGTGITLATPAGHEADAQATRAALRARWEALADSIGDEDDDDGDDTAEIEDPAPRLPPVEVPRRKGSTNPDFMPVPPVAPWRPGTTSELRPEDLELAVPPREPTLILHDDVPRATPPIDAAPAMPSTGAPDAVAMEPTLRERWSNPVLLSELIDRTRDSSRELLANVGHVDELGDLDELDDGIIGGTPGHTPVPHTLRGSHIQALEDLVEPEPPPEPPARPSEDRIGGRDFARQLRAKMSMMAQRLFQSGDSQASQPSVDVRPRHDHHTEIDLAALGEEPALGGGVTEIGRVDAAEQVQVATSPGTWDTQVRERGLPDSGEIVRGVSDTSMIVARMFAISFTGRVGFRKDEVEKVVYFDQGRPVFASSNEPGDRMGELLVREGKITASQYERCQVVVAQSGRRMGEILVDFGYLKRRELLPAVRRHVEDIVYSLFGWDRGHYHMTIDTTASSERIRLSRHPASLVLEGIRRKLDRTTLEKLLGPPSTVIEVPDRERLGGILNTGDLAGEERAALAAFDGQADLAQVARATGVDLADVLPLAWGLCVLGLANARRTETEVEESTALVGETDLAIDRERVRARWQLVTEADYFALLGVRRDATGFEIRRAYQSARRDFAPDGFPGDLRRELARELEDIASVLDEAFRVLRDDRLRQTYLANLIE